MAWTSRSRDAYRIAVKIATGLIIGGSLAATGALAAVAANETAAKEHRRLTTDKAAPVVVRKDRPAKVVPKYITKPGGGGVVARPQAPRRTVVVTRVVRTKTTKSTGS